MNVPHPHSRHWGVVLPVALLGAVLCAVLLGLIGFFVLGLETRPFRWLARTLSLPVAQVNGALISYAEWSDDTRSFIALAEAGKISIPGAISREEIGRNVLERLMRNRILALLAEREGIGVSEAEIEQEYRAVRATETEQRQLLDLLGDLRWSEATLKEKVIKPYLLGRRLADRLGGTDAAEERMRDELARASVKIFLRW